MTSETSAQDDPKPAPSDKSTLNEPTGAALPHLIPSDLDSNLLDAIADRLAPLLQNESFQDAIAQRVVQRLQQSPLLNPAPSILQTRILPRYGRLITLRHRLSLLSTVLMVGCGWNTLQAWHLGERSLGFPLSLLGIGCGLSLVAALVFEVVLGAGSEVETESLQGTTLLRTYQFTPSINRLPVVLLLLAVGFFTIVLGFSSLYAELVRAHPANFAGLEEGLLAIYFTLVTFSTVGFGDIHPVSMVARAAVTAEIAIAMFFSLVALSTTLSWVTAYERQHHEDWVKQRLSEPMPLPSPLEDFPP